MDYCKDKCLPSCGITQFQLSTSFMANFAARSSSDYWKAEVREKRLILKPSPKPVATIQMTSMFPMEEFWGTIGGNMGILLGISIYSIVKTLKDWLVWSIQAVYNRLAR